MTYFKCDSCSKVFEDEDAIVVKDDMGVRDPYPVYVSYYACPHCRSEDYREFRPCDDCHTDGEAEFEGAYCEPCFRRVMAENEDVLAPATSPQMDEFIRECRRQNEAAKNRRPFTAAQLAQIKAAEEDPDNDHA